MGSLLTLMSLGLTLIFGLGRVVNLAHGALYSVGALTMFALVGAGLPFMLALAVVPLIAIVLGALLDVALVARIRNRPELHSLLLTFGVGLALTGVLQRIWSANPRTVRAPEYLREPLTLLGVTYPGYRIFAAIFAIAITVLVLVVLKYSTWGLKVRAINDHPAMAMSLGINRKVLMVSVFAVGSGLAALAGALSTPISGASPVIGETVLIQAFLVIVIGGLGSVRGSVVAGFLVGFATVFGETYIGGQTALLVLFAAVVATLSFMPRGILGEGRVV
jgi:branched-chain amino acid transport system permease protein